MGERKIQSAKPELMGRRGDHTDWTVIGLSRIMKKESLQFLLEKEDQKRSSSLKKFKNYKNRSTFEKSMKENKSLALMLSEGKSWVIIKKSLKKNQMWRIIF